MSATNEPAADAVLLMGPTCTGKTGLALALAREFPVEIISVDSALVYRGMDIGTSKPSAAERGCTPHHLIDICDPAERYSAGRFLRDATRLIGEIRDRGRVPLLVGGTMLYFRALTRGLAPLPEANAAVRAQIDRRAGKLGWARLHAELALVDPEAAKRIRPGDGQRIQRALEVLELTGQSVSALQKLAVPAPFALVSFALMPFDRGALYARIDARFEEMMAAGFLAEVRRLHQRADLRPELPSLRAVGYRQLWEHVRGRCELAPAVAAGQRATRNLAKRQLTWLRADPDALWIRSLEDRELGPIKRVLDKALSRRRSAKLC
jgi:tRNA dimethylallyltransferase